MTVFIDNLDGKGALDYSSAMSFMDGAVVKRHLNAPSTFLATLLPGGGLPVPARRARLVVSSADGTVLFTGYLPNEPERIPVGYGMCGEDAVFAIAAVSDEWLLDQQVIDQGGYDFGVSGETLLASLTEHTDPGRFSVAGAGALQPVGVFARTNGASWSDTAGAIARSSYAAYRVLGGSVTLLPVGAATHTAAELAPGALRLRRARPLANDITVVGDIEPGAYVTEVFTGDGSTAEFLLSSTPFREASSAALSNLIVNFANNGSLDAPVWALTDSGSHLGVGAPGLVLNGGTGLDGEVTLALRAPIELGGSLLFETAGVVLNGASDGVVCGLYSGPVDRANCIAGFDVRQSGGATTVRPLIDGAATGSAATMLSGHVYSLRLHVGCREMHRVGQTFTTMVDGVVQSFGGGAIAADLQVVLELTDLGFASNTPATVLFDGVVAGAAAVATFAPVNSVQLFGSISSVQLAHGGPMLVQSTTSAGVQTTRTLGTAGEGVDAELRGDRLTFLPGRVPAPEEPVTVHYRTTRRAAARVQDVTSVAAEANSGLPGSAQWLGRATQPPARNSADCYAAARAFLAAAASRTAALEGTYEAESGDDLWPGDLLRVSDENQPAVVTIRSVEVQDGGALPEVLRYRATLSNDWAQPLSLQTTSGVPKDLQLPVPLSAGAGTIVPGLAKLSVVSISGSTVQLDMGVNAPTGGGFEVRKRDAGFGPGNDPDLIVRSPVRGFSLPRTAADEIVYVRAFDASVPPMYSAVSAIVSTHVPLS